MRGRGAALVCVAVLAACRERAAVLAPDLVVDFGCVTSPKVELVEAFLSARGFSTVDEELARRKTGRVFFPLQIDGHDRRHVMVEMIGLRKPKSYGNGVDYRLTITSPPPTRHDRGLEDDAVRLVRDTLRCKVRAVNRFENGAESFALFSTVFEDLQRRMHAAGG